MTHKQTNSDRVCLGVIIGAHGVRGLVRVKAFTEHSEAVADYGPVEAGESGARFAIAVTGMAKGAVICRLDGVSDRDKAEAMRGTELYVARAMLPEVDEDEDGYYHADLIGLRAFGADGTDYGRVIAVHNFGAGDLLEIERGDGGASVLVSFIDETVPVVDIAAGRLTLDPPDGLFDDKGPKDE